MMRRISSNQGFTLVELVIIIVILGILAAVAIPKYTDISAEAREAAARSALGSLRSGISIWYANQAVKTGVPSWPPLDSIRAIGTVMEQAIPNNPFQTDANAPDSIVTGVAKGTTVGTRGGWAYNETTGEIWLNTSGTGENNW
jgi:MSHA pilin protein MshA